MKRIKTVVRRESRNQSELKVDRFDVDMNNTVHVILKQTRPDRAIFRLGRDSTSIEVAGTPAQTDLVEIVSAQLMEFQKVNASYTVMGSL